MPNPLSLLPPGTTFEHIKSIVAALPEAGPEVDLTKWTPLKERAEVIFVGGIGSGKTTLLRQLGLTDCPPIPNGTTNERVYGVLDDNGQLDDVSLVRQISAMLKHAKSQRYYQPHYKPIVTVRATTWGRIRGYFQYVPPEQIGRITFPVSAYAEQLRAGGVPEDLIEGFFGPNWTDKLKDAGGGFMPELAWKATKRLAEQTGLTDSKARAVAAAAAEWIQNEPQLAALLPHLVFVVPDDRRYFVKGDKLQIAPQRILSRLRTSMQISPLPCESRPRFLEWAAAAGVWRKRPQNFMIIAPPYAAGLSLIKYRLQQTGIRDMLPT